MMSREPIGMQRLCIGETSLQVFDSEGYDTSNSIPYSLNFAMAGLEIEASEVDGFPATSFRSGSAACASVPRVGAQRFSTLA